MSWHFSQALVAEYSGENSSGGEPSAPWNGAPSAPDDSCSDKMKDTCHRSPFGTMFVPSTDAHGAALLTWYRAASRARTSAPLAAVTALRANGPGSGGKWRAWFARWDPASSSWKTPQSSLLEGSTEFSETWPRSGSMRIGKCYQRPTLVPRIYGSASGLWPTPKASSAGPDFAKLSRSATGISLQTAVAMYPTPRRTDADRGGRGDLIQAVRGNSNPHFAPAALTKHGLWTTPCADDTGHRKGKYAQGGTALSAQAGGALNPSWVEWLMGWPIGWTASEPLETDRFHSWLRQHGAC